MPAQGHAVMPALRAGGIRPIRYDKGGELWRYREI